MVWSARVCCCRVVVMASGTAFHPPEKQPVSDGSAVRACRRRHLICGQFDEVGEADISRALADVRVPALMGRKNPAELVRDITHLCHEPISRL